MRSLSHSHSLSLSHSHSLSLSLSLSSAQPEGRRVSCSLSLLCFAQGLERRAALASRSSELPHPVILTVCSLSLSLRPCLSVAIHLLMAVARHRAPRSCDRSPRLARVDIKGTTAKTQVTGDSSEGGSEILCSATFHCQGARIVRKMSGFCMRLCLPSRSRFHAIAPRTNPRNSIAPLKLPVRLDCCARYSWL